MQVKTRRYIYTEDPGWAKDISDVPGSNNRLVNYIGSWESLKYVTAKHLQYQKGKIKVTFRLDNEMAVNIGWSCTHL